MRVVSQLKATLVALLVSFSVVACVDSPTSPLASGPSDRIRAYAGGTHWEEGMWCELQDYYVNGNFGGTDLLCSPDPTSNNPILITESGMSGETCLGACLAYNNAEGATYGAQTGDNTPAEPPTLAEIILCVSNPTECSVAWASRDIAREWLRMNAPGGAGWNDIWDARRHALWSGLMTINMPGGANSAEIWGNVHEDYAGNDAGERCMDLHNNSVGRQIATSIYNNPSIAPAQRRDALIQAIQSATNLQASPGC